MGSSTAPQYIDTLVHLVLRSRAETLIQSDSDWHVLGLIAERMLFWRGGEIYACRGDGKELRFAIQVARAPIGPMAHHIEGTFAKHLQQTRGIEGAIFRHYTAVPIEEVYLEELVFFLHSTRTGPTQRIWTADDAYLTPGSMPWVSTQRVLTSLSTGSPVPTTYRRKKAESILPDALRLFTGRRPRKTTRDLSKGALAKWQAERRAAHVDPPNIESIARVAAEFCKVPFEIMLTNSRRRPVSKARVIATVLATRQGATAAAAARFFHRSRSALNEQVEYYRENQPQIFAEAEAALESFTQRTARE